MDGDANVRVTPPASIDSARATTHMARLTGAGTLSGGCAGPASWLVGESWEDGRAQVGSCMGLPGRSTGGACTGGSMGMGLGGDMSPGSTG